MVTEYMNGPGIPYLYASGGCVAGPDLTRPGQVCGMTAWHAQRQGTLVTRNVAASLDKDTARPYRHNDHVPRTDIFRGDQRRVRPARREPAASLTRYPTRTERSQPVAVSFARDIRPLFTDMDIAHMRNFGVLLDDFGYMRDPAHAQSVFNSVSTGAMPPSSSGEPSWTPESVQLFEDWMTGGYEA